MDKEEGEIRSATNEGDGAESIQRHLEPFEIEVGPKKATITSSIFNLSNTILGSGTLYEHFLIKIVFWNI